MDVSPTPIIPEGYKVITEGKASIYFGEHNQVFYNKVQVLNRDLSIAVITYFTKQRTKELEAKLKKKQEHHRKEDVPQFQEWMKAHQGIKIFEALSATGLRSIRYFQEIPNVDSILVNDLDPAAVESIQRNIRFNGLDPTKLIANEGDASMVMYQHRTHELQFDVIDLDPYGSAVPFLDSAVQSVRNGGLLCVTCTDMAVLSGNNASVCFAKYGSMPNKAHYLHEMSLRIVLHAIESTANKYQRHIVPVLSCSIDFYVRLFVRVYKKPAEVNKASLKSAYVWQCTACESFDLQPVGVELKPNKCGPGPGIERTTCRDCGRKLKMSGPIWSDPIHDVEAISEILAQVNTESEAIPTFKRLHGLLTTCAEEIQTAPLYYTLPGLCKTLHCTSPPLDQVKAALMNAGYVVSQAHKVPEAVKTNAPNVVMWDILRAWVKLHPLTAQRVKSQEDTPGRHILAQASSITVDFTVPASLRVEKNKACRFPANPEAFWGPKRRAVGNHQKKRVLSEPEGEEGA